jgi:hypothetical protein
MVLIEIEFHFQFASSITREKPKPTHAGDPVATNQLKSCPDMTHGRQVILKPYT